MYFLFYSISLRSDKNMMGLQNLCTLFGPTLMKLSPKEQQIDDMAKEIKESMQQAQALFYILKLHEENRLIADPEQKEQLEKIAQTQQNNESPTKKTRPGLPPEVLFFVLVVLSIFSSFQNLIGSGHGLMKT